MDPGSPALEPLRADAVQSAPGLLGRVLDRAGVREV
jgi:hypothetical protein